MLNIIFSFILVGLLSNCNYRAEKSVQVFKTGPTFESIKEQIFKPNCWSCHSGPEAEMGIDLSNYSKLMSAGTGVILPGNPLNSTLYLNVQSGRMPLGAPRLSDTEIKVISDWISEGAREN
ncbi:MAG: hypothetical protein NT000_00275 [Proteobacteria bacterium]|nr:hypothetical protein [Pseudomonadota bacterium]